MYCTTIKWFLTVNSILKEDMRQIFGLNRDGNVK